MQPRFSPDSPLRGKFITKQLIQKSKNGNILVSFLQDYEVEMQSIRVTRGYAFIVATDSIKAKIYWWRVQVLFHLGGHAKLHKRDLFSIMRANEYTCTCKNQVIGKKSICYSKVWLARWGRNFECALRWNKGWKMIIPHDGHPFSCTDLMNSRAKTLQR